MTDQGNNQITPNDQNQTPAPVGQGRTDGLAPQNQTSTWDNTSQGFGSSAPSQTPVTNEQKEDEPSFPLEDFVSDTPAPSPPQSPASTTNQPVQASATQMATEGQNVSQPPRQDPPQASQQTPSTPQRQTDEATASASPQPSSSQQAPATPIQPPPSVPKEPLSAQTQPQPNIPQAPPPSSAPPAQVPKAPPIPAKVGKGAIIRRSSFVGKTLFTIFISILALCAIFFFFFYRVTIIFDVSPEGAKTTVDEKEIAAKTIKLNPGFHSIKIEKDGYVSYFSSRKFSIGEKVNLSLELKKAITTEVFINGAKTLDLSKSGNLINFLGEDSRLYYIALDQQQSQALPLSNQQFPNLKKVLYSPSNDFAIILDDENLKIADFNKIDPTTQEEATNLPPASSAITTLDWNETSSAFVKKATSKLLYDMKTPTSWDLFLMDLTSLQSQIIMRVDSSLFPSLNVDWGESAKTALITGKKAGILDIGKRDFTQFDEEFVYGQWGPSGKIAILQKADKSIYILKENRIEGLSLKADEFFFSDEKEAYFLQENSLTMVNFDTLSQINYAEISGLSQAKSFVVAQENVYFLDDQGIKSAKLQRGIYGEIQEQTNR